MILQILVPRYNESEDVMNHLLSSIAMQENVNFKDVGVIICDDGSDSRLSEGFLESFPFKIKYISIDHRGVSATRQACLDASTADYVMFCDADDMFYINIAIWYIFRDIEVNHYNMLVSKFIQETRDVNGEIVYIDMPNDGTYVHGKIFNRSWLIKNNIRWDPELTIHEDSYFISLAKVYGEEEPNKCIYCDFPFYLWRFSIQSVCHRDKKYYVVKSFKYLIQSNTSLLRELIKRNKMNSVYYYCASLIFTFYYYSNCDTFLDPKNKEYVEESNAAFREYYKEFGHYFEEMDSQFRKEIGNNVRSVMVNDVCDVFYIESFTLKEWFENVLKIDNKKSKHSLFKRN